jgi:tetratricopeptide (TPR) repeat protein
LQSSYRIGRFGNTEICAHISLALIIPIVLLQARPNDLWEALWSLSLVATLFVCILLHEIGHTIAARRFGLEVHSIVLWPLGGFATLDQRPEKPLVTLVIAAAGPLVNWLLAMALAVLAAGLIGLSSLAAPYWPGVYYYREIALLAVVALAAGNLVLAVFNLAPIYPLDGGQITRSLLEILFGRRRADLLTMVIAIPLALALATYAAWQRDLFLLVISLLLILGAATLNRNLFRLLSLAYTAVANRSAFYLVTGDFDRAIDRYSQAIQRGQQPAGVYLGRALAYLGVQDYTRAQADAQQALALEPENALAISFLGDFYFLAGLLDQALENCERLIALKPDWAVGYADRGLIYRELGEPERALADFDHALHLDPHLVKVYVLRAMLRYRLGDLAGARRDGDQAVHLSPKEALIHSEPFLKTTLGYMDWALDFYGRAALSLPGSPLPYQGRADACLANAGRISSTQLTQAIADYTQAIRLAPRQANLYLARGRAYQYQGDMENAAADFQLALVLNGKPHLHRQAQALLGITRAPASPPAAL